MPVWRMSCRPVGGCHACWAADVMHASVRMLGHYYYHYDYHYYYSYDDPY
jgi:hypothetical protein